MLLELIEPVSSYIFVLLYSPYQSVNGIWSVNEAINGIEISLDFTEQFVSSARDTDLQYGAFRHDNLRSGCVFAIHLYFCCPGLWKQTDFLL